MRKLIAEIFDPATRYEYDVARALESDARFKVERDARDELGDPEGV